MAKLTLDDIADLRAYERERDDFRRSVIELKQKRRVALGPVITLLFENRDTIRFQIQEMARAEKIMSDEGIQVELDVYNPLIPDPGTLAATLFIELTSDAELRTWLPALVGIETMIELRVGPDQEPVRCVVDADHEQQLTRQDITAAVHYIHFALSPEQIAALAAGAATLASVHPAYRHETPLRAETVAELERDLTGQ